MSDNDQAARIAELKAVRDSWCEEATRQRDRIAELEAQGRKWMAQAVTQESRIAELEAERDAAKQGRQFVLKTMQEENDGLREVNDLLRAERDRLKAALEPFAEVADLHDHLRQDRPISVRLFQLRAARSTNAKLIRERTLDGGLKRIAELEAALYKARARIAELEAERDSYHATNENLSPIHRGSR